MRLGLSPTQSDIQTVLRSFLLSILATGVEVIEGQDNRVPEPQGVDFVAMWPIRRPRLSTNVDGYVDCKFTGSISGTTLTVSSVAFGEIAVGSPVFGVSVATGTFVTAFESGSGGPGTYAVSVSQTAPSETMAAGVGELTQPTMITMQLDVHGPNSSDNAQIISTALRDDYAVEFFVAANPLITPLYAEDPKQVPFENDQSQVEYRWIVEAQLQADQSVTVPQQFADAVTVDVIDVDVAYPA